MLIKPSIDEMEIMSEDRYLIATLAAARARDLAKRKRPITEEIEYKEISQAAKEIAAGLITYKEDSLHE